LGADDYITKPFGVRELVSRVKAVLRRSDPVTGSHPDDSIKLGDLELFPGLHKVEKSGVEINLSLKEYQLLEALMREPGKVFTRDVLLDKIWGYDYFGETRTVDVHIRYLRRKLDDDGPDFKYIDTVRGVGYKMKTWKA
jgi:DNA-binding response OmpR family regulator